VWDGNTGYVYYDGTLLGSVTNSQTVNDDSGGLSWGQEQDTVLGGYNAGQSIDGEMAELRMYSGAASETQVLNHLYIADSSFLQTGAKSYSRARQPDFEDLSYTLNGETARLVAIGDPAGTSEEQSVTLDGDDSYALSWNGSYSDFAVRIELETADVTVTPIIDSVSLIG